MPPDFYIKATLSFLIQISVFILAFRVFKKRRERGFLFLTISLGLQAAFALISAIGMLGLVGAYELVLDARVSWILQVTPFITLFGWIMLARSEHEKA